MGNICRQTLTIYTMPWFKFRIAQYLLAVLLVLDCAYLPVRTEKQTKNFNQLKTRNEEVGSLGKSKEDQPGQQ